MSLGLRGVRVSILGGKYIIRRTNELAIGRCVNNLMKELIEEAQVY